MQQLWKEWEDRDMLTLSFSLLLWPFMPEAALETA
jgi:hypothetical protein